MIMAKISWLEKVVVVVVVVVVVAVVVVCGLVRKLACTMEEYVGEMDVSFVVVVAADNVVVVVVFVGVETVAVCG